MKALVIGGDGAAHAVTWKLAQSPAATAVYTAPGNHGTNQIGPNLSIAGTDVEALADWTKAEEIPLTVVTSSTALRYGVADVFRERELHIVGASQEVVRRCSGEEGASLMRGRGIAAARVGRFTDRDAARGFLELFPSGASLRITAEGGSWATPAVLAPGRAEAQAVIDAALTPERRGPPPSVRIEEYPEGTRVSLLALSDGATILALGVASVCYRGEDGERGALTEGLGAYGPLGDAEGLQRWAVEQVLRPCLDALAAEGLQTMGVYCLELVLTERGPLVQALAPGFGDLAAQVLLPCWDDDLYVTLDALCEGALAELRPFRWGQDVACGVVLASEGYPGEIETGYGVLGLGEVPGRVLIFQNETRNPHQPRGELITPKAERAARSAFGGNISGWFLPSRGRAKQVDSQARRAGGDPYSQVVTAGGRVLTVVGRGRSLADARAAAYRGLAPLGFTGSWYRRDIAAVEAALPGDAGLSQRTPARGHSGIEA